MDGGLFWLAIMRGSRLLAQHPLQFFGQSGDPLRRDAALVCKGLDLGRDDGETGSVFAGARRLDPRIQRQQLQGLENAQDRSRIGNDLLAGGADLLKQGGGAFQFAGLFRVDVDDHALEADRLAIGAVDRPAALMNPLLGAISTQDAVIHFPVRARRYGRSHRRIDRTGIIGVDDPRIGAPRIPR